MLTTPHPRTAPILHPAPWARLMGRWCLSLGLGMTLIGLAPQALAQDASRCYSIRDNDRKNMCLALARRDASACYSIRDNDDKNLCLAQVRGQRSYCYSIRDNDQKNQCLAMVR